MLVQKKILVQKKCWSKKIVVQNKFLAQKKYFGLEKYWSEKRKNILIKKKLDPKIKNFGKKKCQKNCGLKLNPNLIAFPS